MAAVGERGTRERILEVAEDFFGARGYEGTRLHLIAERVGIQKASLFHYFPSKEELYRAVVGEGVGETEATIARVLSADMPPIDKLRLLLEAYVDMVAAHPQRTKILLRQSLGDAPSNHQPLPDSQRLFDMVISFVADNQRRGTFAAMDPLALVLGVIGMAAFFFTSAPVLAPARYGDPSDPAVVGRVKHHVVEVVERCLAIEPRSAAPRLAAAGAD